MCNIICSRPYEFLYICNKMRAIVHNAGCVRHVSVLYYSVHVSAIRGAAGRVYEVTAFQC